MDIRVRLAIMEHDLGLVEKAIKLSWLRDSGHGDIADYLGVPTLDWAEERLERWQASE